MQIKKHRWDAKTTDTCQTEKGYKVTIHKWRKSTSHPRVSRWKDICWPKGVYRLHFDDAQGEKIFCGLTRWSGTFTSVWTDPICCKTNTAFYKTDLKQEPNMMAVGWSGTDLLLQGLDFIDGTIKKSPAISFWPNMAEIKQFCQGKWSKIPSKWCKRLLPAIRNAWWPLLLPRVTQLVIRFRGSNYFFTETHTGLDLPGLSCLTVNVCDDQK